MRTPLLWAITQRIVVISYWGFRNNLSVPGLLTLEDGMDRLSRNVRKMITIRCVITQKIAVLKP
jgi:hypothetical protein